MDKKVLIIVSVVVVVGAVIGLGVTGIVPIPGLTHAKHKKKKAEPDPVAEKKDDKAKDPVADAAKAKATADEAKAKDEADKAAKLAAADKEAADKRIADEKGYKKLAGVWAEMGPDKLGPVITAHYKPETAAPILKLMDEDQVAALFGAMKPEEAASFSEALAKEVGKPVLVDSAKS